MAGTIYPTGIDGFPQLPLVSDGTSPIRAADVNNIRDAVIAVEKELGINPSGTYGTVKSRLDALDSIIDFLTDGYGTGIGDLAVDYIAGLLEAPANKSYKLTLNIPFAGFVDTLSTVAISGTATATISINGTPLGGSANAVSSTEDVEAHTSDNTFVAGDDITLAISSNVEATDVSFTLVYVRT